jgi:hypothetical protein
MSVHATNQSAASVSGPALVFMCAPLFWVVFGPRRALSAPLLAQHTAPVTLYPAMLFASFSQPSINYRHQYGCYIWVFRELPVWVFKELPI